MRSKLVRLMSLALVAAVIAFPAAASAGNGNVKGKAGPDSRATAGDRGGGRGLGEHGREAKAEAKRQREESREQRREEKAAEKLQRRAEKRARRSGELAGLASIEESGSVDGTETPGTDEAPGAEESSSTTGPVRRGVANALDRIQQNLERMQAAVDAGTRDHLPPGLLRVVEKFMGWLGLVQTPDATAPDGEASDETSGTVDPPDGSDETSMSPGPSDDDTSTPVTEGDGEPATDGGI